MPQEYNTKFIRSDGIDMGKVLLTREYLLSVYPQIANQFVTPELWVWGDQNFSLLTGTNDQVNRYTPVTTFAGGSNWKQISYGYCMSGIKSDGTLWVWGQNNNGTLGVNHALERSTPVTTFAGGNNWKQISSGNTNMAAIKTDGTLWVWGDNSYGQLGINAVSTASRSTPVTTFAGGTNWKQVSMGFRHVAAIKTDGTLWVWGNNSYGHLGINDAFSRSTPVTTFAGGNNWKQVSCGWDHTIAIKTDGTLWGWGQNNNGQLAINDNRNIVRSTPVTTFAGGNDWSQVSATIYSTYAIKTDGTLWVWGYNNGGELGINDSIRRSTPVTTFAGGNTWKRIGLSITGSVSVIKTDGTLWHWGSPLAINDSSNNSRRTPVTTFLGGNNWKYASGNAAIRSSEEL